MPTWRPIHLTALMKRYRVPLGAVAALLIAFSAWMLYAFFWGNQWEGDPERVVYVSRGETFGSIADSLSAKGIVRSRALFVFVAKISGGISRLQIGKYVFRSGVSNAAVYGAMRSGRGSLISVTVPEGLQSRQQAKLFSRTLGLDSARFETIVYDQTFIRSFGIDAPSLEGYLLPDTYAFAWQHDEKDVIRRMVEEFQRFFVDSLQERAHMYGWNTTQALALASIIEGETHLAGERPVVSGVYHNRLKKGMRLEADPTIQYILDDGPRRVLYDDLHIESPYNTYIHAGLPPGPVNNPGRASILAALYPSDHHYLYFVANGTGGHWFSRTFEEHERHVRMFRRVRARQHAALAPGEAKRSIQQNHGG